MQSRMELRLPAPIKAARNAHPLAKFLLDKIVESGLTREEVCRRAGLNDRTVYEWASALTGSIGLQNMEAMLQVVGYGLKPYLLPTTSSGYTLVQPGIFNTRCGELVEIEGVDPTGRAYGHVIKYKVSMSWNLEGRRIPVAGKDPFDLILKAAPAP